MGTINELIKHKREQGKLSVYKLAKMAGITQTALKNIESGGSCPAFGTVERITAAMGFEIKIVSVPTMSNDTAGPVKALIDISKPSILPLLNIPPLDTGNELANAVIEVEGLSGTIPQRWKQAKPVEPLKPKEEALKRAKSLLEAKTKK